MLDDEVAKFLETVGPNGPEAAIPLSDDPDELARCLAVLRARRPAGAVRDATVASRDIAIGHGIPLRVYTPTGSEGRPAILFMHGGGWVFGDLDTFDAFSRSMAARSRMVLVSVDYRLAPEHPFPAGLNDSAEALEWLRANATGLGCDPGRVVLMGTSSGGNLAAALAASAARDPRQDIVQQVLIYPALDSTMSTDSIELNSSGYYLTSRQMDWFWRQYAPEPATRSNPLVSPTHSESLEGLPAAIVVTAEYDPLRDEGRDYAERLATDGVPVRHLEFPGQIHGFMGLIGIVAAAEEGIERVADALSTAVEVR